jgi:LysM repeat protein
MLKAMRSILLGSTVLVVPSIVQADTVHLPTARIATNQLAGKPPLRTTQSYTVKYGDTLWGIAGHFLVHPWQWPRVWHNNPYIKDPNLIYPGNILKISTSPNGVVSISVENKRTVVLEPKMQMTAIPSVRTSDVATYLRVGYTIKSEDKYQHLPVLYAAKSGHLTYYAGDTLYVNNVHHPKTQNRYAIVQLGHRLSTYKENKALGYSLRVLGTGTLSNTGKHPTLLVISAKHEIVLGDRLIPITKAHIPHYFPSTPTQNIHGHIIASLSGVPETTVGQTVIIDRGSKNDLRNGNVLRIESRHPTGVLNGDTTSLPRKNVGYLMLFKVSQKLSYGVITVAKRGIVVGDTIVSPTIKAN